MKEEKLIFDEVGIRIKLPFEDTNNKEQRETLIVKNCGCNKSSLTTEDLEKKAKKQIAASYVFLASELRLMQIMSKKIIRAGGDILEIGFGLGFAANAIQSELNINSHTIIEEHPDLYKKALDWAKDKKTVNVIFGNWLNVLPTLTKKFTGVFCNARLDKNCVAIHALRKIHKQMYVFLSRHLMK